MHEAEKLVKSSAIWVISSGTPEVPLTEHGGCIANSLQLVGNRFLTGRQPSSRVFVSMTNRIEFISKSGLIATG